MEKPFADIAERIRWHRSLMAMTQKEYAAKAGIARPRFNNWEMGVQRVSVDGALALREAYGLSLDFIYLGNQDALPMALRKALIETPIIANDEA